MPSYSSVYSDWVTHKDVGELGAEIVVTLKNPSIATFKDSRSGEEKKQIAFVVPEMEGRKFGLNITNAKMMEQLTGTDDYNDWSGTRVTMFVDDTQVAGETKLCVRFRPKLPATTDNSKEAPPATAQVLGTVAAERLMNKINTLAGTNPLITIASLRLYLEAHYPQHRDHMAKNAPEDWPAEVIGTIKTWLDNPTVTTKLAKGELDDDEIPF